MSREDPQLRIRLPIELKEKIEETAKANNRSMNAEIVRRLESSFLKEIPDDEIISAQAALQIVIKAKEELSRTIYKRTFAHINKKVRIGHTTFHIDLTDLDLEGLSDVDFESIFQPTFVKLKELGYTIPDSWDVDGFLVDIPDPETNKKPT
ncbi:Arc family DNA-binding protein [Citrobacter freundii]|uniref:Arc family DNA-binding protein n=1 Tax=Citrobacter freundii complex TaxID=1344959 RepID=UPI0008FD828C|nr:MULTISPECIES: Arc family DNA-binding protein [Citrobacter freundii complex]AYL70505.1 Arc family DNA-binding protein [Citrobacter freundii]AYL71634.1 Arc family DNA-binding protein [Citrobacter freundii]EJG2196470.1 Arc family DNA-binding protein [Citrobacter freundii]EKA7904285.1 Arc family DNA-binding protein [Citrobacter freundii]EKV5431225.1 Arc family DNA-binding protein [Citrobacter freundii]